jgi:hypothetical protein
MPLTLYIALHGTSSGDSTLHGLYMMAMTGNHTAMATADTVMPLFFEFLCQ